METIACFVGRTRGPVVPFVDDWYPWAYAHHYLRTEIENMPLELGRVMSSVRVDDAVALIQAWCAATGEDVDEAVHMLADAYLERWGLAPPEDVYDGEYAGAFGEDDVYAGVRDVYAEEDDDQFREDDDLYAEEGEDPTQLIPVVPEQYAQPGEDAAQEPVKAEAEAAEAESGAKSDRSGKGDRPARTPRPVKAADRALAEQILAADQALVAEHPLVTGRPLAARR